MEYYIENTVTEKFPRWEVVLINHETKPFVYRPTEGFVPCWFHRKMQELFFGVKWRKVSK